MNNRKIINIIALVILLMTSCEKDPLALVGKSSMIELNNPVISSITQVGAAVSIGIKGGGDGDIIERGICWSTAVSPTTSSAKNSLGAGTGIVTVGLTGLTPGTNYYTRAYFQTKYETIYSGNISFRTIDYQLPTVVTSSISSITMTSAVGSSSVASAGGGTVSSRGLCWSTTILPTIANSRIVSGSGTGSFTGDISALNPGTTYYVRAYATNQAGTAYGAQVSFVTNSVQLPTVGSLSISAIAKNSVFVIGTVSADGGGTISSKGICYASNTTAPTINSNSFINNGSGIGSTGGTISGLVSGTNYYVRAYAVNSAGVSYGPVSSFKTL